MKWVIRSIILIVLLLSSFNIGIGHTIRNQVGGCDCEDIGTWSPDTLTCTLTGNVSDIIEIDSDDITLDGNGYSATEIYVHENSGYIIENFVGASYINIWGSKPGSDSGIIRGNTITGVGGKSINIFVGNYIEIADNTISHCSGGIYLSMSTNINITNNTVHDNEFDGILCCDSSYYNNIMDNTIFDNNGCGISMITAGYHNVKNNIINDNDCGIKLWYAVEDNISGNTISNNSNDGIWLYEDNNKNTIMKNSISYNGRYGIYMEGCNNDGKNSIICNNILGNEYGIYILNTNGNILYHNSIFGNSLYNGYESLELGSNQWCIAGEGNYWGNYNEPCEFCIDSDDDGICDSPYYIPGGLGVDYYPLVSPLCSPDWCEIYNTNGIDGIQKAEAVDAMNDYLIFHRINKEATVAVLNCYFGL